MASIVIAGDTSGSVTISAPAIAGTPTLTLPTTSGTLVVTGGAQTIEFAAGSAAAPSITFTGDTNTGIFSPTADTIGFSEGGVEAMRIDSSGNVQVGTTTSAGKVRFYQTADAPTLTLTSVQSNFLSSSQAVLNIVTTNGVSNPTTSSAISAAYNGNTLFYVRNDGFTNINIPARTSGTNYTALLLSDNVTGGQTVGFGTRIMGSSNGGNAISVIGFESGGGGANNDTQIGFYTQATAGGLTRRVTIGYTGMLALEGGNANATGTGIAFPATQSASSDANTLDDYEEGTWTPTVTNGTVAATLNNYIKIGKQVTVWGRLSSFSDRTSGSNVTINNLPFISDARTDQSSQGNSIAQYISNMNGLTPYISTSGTTLIFYDVRSGAFRSLLHSDLNNVNSDIYFFATYRAAN